MPELPEVETVMRGLEKSALNHVVSHVKVNRYDLRVPVPADLGQSVTGGRITKFQRRGKYILVHFDRDVSLIIHLGMSGRMRIFASAAQYEPRKHDHIIMTMDNDVCIAFEDPRRFGMFYYVGQDQWSRQSPFDRMGPEPLDNWNADQLHAALDRRKSPIKNALLDQRIVAGLGNIYVCEALHRARISPFCLASDISHHQAEGLIPIICDILKDAIKSGGSTLKDYQHTDGSLGYFQHSFRVYDREGEPCTHKECAGVVERAVQSGRSTFYCSTCQK
ncbi:MAG: bifunctional DNA-formamidopyrimidine glycosylase/DNA-(apurinic or apyrimidinic site) lyase [Alphaproteobacteria bacterium]